MDCAAALHQDTGPELLETVYEAVPARNLEAWDLREARQVPIPLSFTGSGSTKGFVQTSS
ncbi:MAG TPA: GxxExxY protein [Candidatus Hydrogenedentes bacterium]|nr:GxxExxY protein [Candidatus Hydrogenedentota bacterium]HQE82278.1 GxxExxY protein [Candidatus Hydrogenedentota bacterium]HQH51556.1 GxxExxY protein [Candidatus Hydrogenedentota bacterium]HQM48812.1 GxxExxY protein [Candidatus Hydrogenedentota bacterium]